MKFICLLYFFKYLSLVLTILCNVKSFCIQCIIFCKSTFVFWSIKIFYKKKKERDQNKRELDNEIKRERWKEVKLDRKRGRDQNKRGIDNELKREREGQGVRDYLLGSEETNLLFFRS